MNVVVDTVVVNKLLRTPKGRPPAQRTALDDYMRNGELKAHVDAQRGLISEWENSCGTDHIKNLVVRWVDFGGIVTVHSLGRTPHSAARRLLQLGFRDTVDKLIVRIALAIEQPTVVSHDPDFYDPTSRTVARNGSGPVADLLRNDLGIEVVGLARLLTILKQ